MEHPAESAVAELPPLSEIGPSPYGAVRGGLTLADYFAMPVTSQPTELIEGELYVAPAPFLLHQNVVTELTYVLTAWVKAGSLGRVVVSPVDLIVGKDTVLQPDILFLARGHPQINATHEPLSHPPELVVEVLSRGRMKRDLDVKFRLYQSAGVPNYWIVDPEAKTVEAWTLKGAADGKYVRVDAVKGGVFSAPPFEGLAIEVAGIWPKVM